MDRVESDESHFSTLHAHSARRSRAAPWGNGAYTTVIRLQEAFNSTPFAYTRLGAHVSIRHSDNLHRGPSAEAYLFFTPSPDDVTMPHSCTVCSRLNICTVIGRAGGRTRRGWAEMELRNVLDTCFPCEVYHQI